MDRSTSLGHILCAVGFVSHGLITGEAVAWLGRWVSGKRERIIAEDGGAELVAGLCRRIVYELGDSFRDHLGDQGEVDVSALEWLEAELQSETPLCNPNGRD